MGNGWRMASRILSRDRRGVVDRISVGQQDGELVAAEAGDGVAVAKGRLHALRDRLQQLVADVVPERVVDELEAVEIEEEHGQACFLRAAPVR